MTKWLIFFTLCFSLNMYATDFDNLYINNGGKIDFFNIKNVRIKYYHYQKRNKAINSMDISHFIVQFNNELINNKFLEKLLKQYKAIYLKSTNAISLNTSENKLGDFLLDLLNKNFKFNYIEEVPAKTPFEVKSNKVFNKSEYNLQKTPMDKTINQNEAEIYKPNDPYFVKQWHLTNKENNSDIGYLGYRKFLETSGFKTNLRETALIGVVDIGIFYDYPDLKDRIYVNNKEIPNNNIDDDNNGYIDDYRGVDIGHPECINNACIDMYNSHHGTEMASIIASATDNGIDITGIAPDAIKLLPINSSKDYEKVDTYIEAYEYLLDMKERGANIVGFNISAGGGASKTEYEYMKKLEEADIIVIASAGNDKMLIDPMNGVTMENDSMGVYPAKYDTKNIISVGAYDENGAKASFSNYGNRVHIYTPGISIISQPYPEIDKLIAVDGTSPAAAVMSGIIGIAKYLYPECSNIALRDFIINKASESMGKFGTFDVKTIKLSSTCKFSFKIDPVFA